eukprot:3661962-Pyramimonas_sp.AAC.1
MESGSSALSTDLCDFLVFECPAALAKAWSDARSCSAKAVEDWLIKALPRGAMKAHAWLRRDEGDPLEFFRTPERVLQLPAEMMAYRAQLWGRFWTAGPDRN